MDGEEGHCERHELNGRPGKTAGDFRLSSAQTADELAVSKAACAESLAVQAD